MTLTAIGTLATTTITSLGGQVLLVVTAIVGLTLAYFFVKWVVKKIKGSIA